MVLCKLSHVLDGSDAVKGLFLPPKSVTVVLHTQQVTIVTQVKVQLIVMAMGPHHVNHLTMVVCFN